MTVCQKCGKTIPDDKKVCPVCSPTFVPKQRWLADEDRVRNPEQEDWGDER